MGAGPRRNWRTGSPLAAIGRGRRAEPASGAGERGRSLLHGAPGPARAVSSGCAVRDERSAYNINIKI